MGATTRARVSWLVGWLRDDGGCRVCWGWGGWLWFWFWLGLCGCLMSKLSLVHPNPQLPTPPTLRAPLTRHQNGRHSHR